MIRFFRADQRNGSISTNPQKYMEYQCFHCMPSRAVRAACYCLFVCMYVFGSVSSFRSSRSLYTLVRCSILYLCLCFIVCLTQMGLISVKRALNARQMAVRVRTFDIHSVFSFHSALACDLYIEHYVNRLFNQIKTQMISKMIPVILFFSFFREHLEKNYFFS